MYNFILSDLICYGHEQHFFVVPSFDVMVEGVAKWARVKGDADVKKAALLEAITTSTSITLTPDMHYFQPSHVRSGSCA